MNGERCERPMRGLYGEETLCARPSGHRGACDSIYDEREWPGRDMNGERMVVYRCVACGHIEGSFPQAGCCASCGDSGDPLTVEVVPWSRPLPSQRDDSKDPLANVERLLDIGIGYTLATGRLFCPIDKFHEFVEKLLGRPISTHEFADHETWEKLRAKFEADTLARSLGGDPQ